MTVSVCLGNYLSDTRTLIRWFQSKQTIAKLFQNILAIRAKYKLYTFEKNDSSMS